MGPPSANRPQVSFRVVRADGGPEMSIPMTGETLTCGTRADLTLPDDPFIAPVQARFFFSGQRLAIEDLGGGNGVFARLKSERELPVGGEDLVEVAAIHELHRDEQRPIVGLAEVEDVDGVGVVEPACGLGFTLEARDGACVLLQRGVQQLQHHRLLEHQLVGAVDAAHPALSEQLLHPVFPGHHLAEVRVPLLLPGQRVSAGPAELGVGGGLGGAGRAVHDR